MYDLFKKLSKHLSIFAIASALSKAVSFLLLPIYTRYLTPADYGILELLSVTMAILNVIVILGMSSAFFKVFTYDCESDSDQRLVVSTAFFFLLADSLFFFTILYFFAAPISTAMMRNSGYTHLFVLMLFTGFLGINNLIPFGILRSRLESVKYTVIQFIQFIVSVGLNIYFVVFLKQGIQGILWSGVLGNLLGFLLLLPVLLRYLSFKVSFARLKQMLLFGVPMIPAGLGLWVMTVSDRYFLQYFSTTHELGLYALGYKFASIFEFLIITPFITVWPSLYLSTAKKSEAPQIFARLFTYFWSALAFLLVLTTLLIKPVIHFITTPEFYAAHAVVPILVMAIILYGANQQLDIGLVIKERTKYLMYNSLTAAAINLLLNYLLIPAYGMMGAAVATLVAYLANCILNFFFSQRFYPIRYEWSRVLQISVIAGGLCLITEILPVNSLGYGLIWLPIVTAAYWLALFFIGFFSPGEMAFIKGFYQRCRGELSRLAVSRKPIAP
ncbi:MAG: polysaccharide biosynthesis C-terminal domain-containing protein [candidate division KSB1 bacterium]|nr:polysaccharide biosynthesis C-terminal domain-containing protein [candidate division KSB1 bacterium]MDZ7301667.1 polysaccharide biosynthesis C-terminal domain-containing protein [candidate division KSB1 bacterium]MDZ7314309.1 polysaccharide biosynthesis C-terminal domain-containing protein [candidate division KSB1 bacterium]